MKKVLYLFLSAAVLLVSCESDSDNDAIELSADFTYEADNDDYLQITFTNLSENATDFTWDFGDGETSAEESPTHSYARPGQYEVTLTVLVGDQNESYSETIDLKPNEAITDFVEIASITVGGAAAAEISAFDPQTSRLFVVNNEEDSRIDVLDLTDPASPQILTHIPITAYGGGVNSVAVKEGLLAAAVQAHVKQDNGKVVVFNTSDYSEVASVTVGALPDMVTFSPDGNYILSANEGEPSSDYSVDPEGSVSIISTSDYTVVTAGFSAFESELPSLKAAGYRVYGPQATLAQDTEPEYIAVSADSKTAFVTLQENNGMAIVDIESGVVTDIFPLGFKDHSMSGNEMDPSDKDGAVTFRKVPVFGMYEPDAVASFVVDGEEYLITVNEGDAREYDTFEEEVRVKDLALDPSVFTDAGLLEDENLGRLTVTSTLGDADGDEVYEALYCLGARSFSIWDPATGALLHDSGNDLETDLVNNLPEAYDDERSDNKGVEPEGVTVGEVGGKPIAFVGMERADAVAMYDISNPQAPQFVKVLATGDAPEGIVFVSYLDSPSFYSLLIVSSENDGTVKIYSAR